ncbi:ABC transporter ATP-binding protein/permease [Collinsella sp. AGMB00827]|uniref:ABC transporter ATP-binding protein/permease n=1 Tax=Collinsella ureilytica TaxID=2869515 RepID=A0ABS7MKV3_9ACTN|nr:ABC transporter ATP-binding protein [Collinsella urealyticum]MBY4797706.1 ABC transporter ATP-binding protein/permease [Collinsella urealyticum]
MIKTLASSIRQYRGAVIVTPLLVMGEVLFEVLIPFGTAALIGQVKAGAPLPELFASAGVLALMALISLGFGAAAGLTCARASVGFSKNLRTDMFRAVQSFDFSTIDSFSSSSLVTRMTTDVQNVQMAFMMLIRTAFRAPLMIIFAFSVAYVMGGWLAFIYLAVIPVLGISLFAIIRTARPIFKRIFRKYDRLNESAGENLAGIRVVKSYVREDYEIEKFDAAAEEVRREFTRAERILALNSPIMNFCVYTVMVFVIGMGSFAIIDSRATLIDVGQFSSLITYGFQILMSLMMLSMVFALVTIAEEGAGRIYEVLTASSQITSPEGGLTEVSDGSIDFEGVGLSYGGAKDREALSDINLHIASGETIGIIGSTGSAKSSLVQLISRLYDASRGRVLVGGHDVRDYDLDVLRSEVAMVLQKNQLFSGTIAENLRWGNPEATDEEVREAAKLAQADEFVQGFPDGYDHMIEQGSTNVSGGQKQRLCIARALLKRPQVLILDDSTSAVDTKTDRLIRDGLKNYLPETTKIIIAQRTGSVEDADRIIVMNEGKIDSIGTHEELLHESEIYREVYISQNKQSHDERVDELEEEEVSEDGNN